MGEAHSQYMKILELAVTPEEFWGKEGQCMERPSHSVWQNADAYAITVTDLGGTIRGSNNRSVLLGAYRYLKELGFAFLRPDREGNGSRHRWGLHGKYQGGGFQPVPRNLYRRRSVI